VFELRVQLHLAAFRRTLLLRPMSGSGAPGWTAHPSPEGPDEVSDVDDDHNEDDYIPVELVTTTSEIGAPEPVEGVEVPPTVLDRLLRAGISSERAEGHPAAGTVVVDGERITDPNTPAAMPARVVLKPA
jgi:hypothetical protein